MVFFTLSFLFLAGYAYRPEPWWWIGFSDSILVGWVWTLIPEKFARAPATIRDFFPVAMLILFMLVLCETHGKLGSDSLFYTASALVIFRTLYFMLRVVSLSILKVPLSMGCWFGGLCIQLFCDGSRVYQSIRPMAFLDPLFLNVIHLLSVRALFVLVIGGWAWEKKGRCLALYPGLMLLLASASVGMESLFQWALFWVGAGFVVELCIMLGYRKLLNQTEKNNPGSE